MDDLHPKTRDTGKTPNNPQNNPLEGSGERSNATEKTPGDTDGAATVADAANQVSTLVRNVGEQAWSAASTAGGTAQEMMRQARDQVSGVSGAMMESGSRANDYIARNINEYPLAALLIAGAVGYGVAYLMHNSWQGQGEPRAAGSRRTDSKK
jgi:hypothetical protein